ncbi:MAG: restriction endonuclease subunit S [Peptostreptococcaceae bacterium]
MLILNKDEEMLEELDKITWSEFNLKELFGESTRGKKLKNDDRVIGYLPFVTAGETDTGVSAFIGNDVKIFSNNTVTIDMFGSAKYINYKYGADDHITVVHTENLSKNSSIFLTTSIHKSSYTGEFNYGKNF